MTNFAQRGTAANAIAANTYSKPRTIRHGNRKINKSIAFGRRGILARDCGEVTAMIAKESYCFAVSR
jgi:hypothetical protein